VDRKQLKASKGLTRSLLLVTSSKAEKYTEQDPLFAIPMPATDIYHRDDTEGIEIQHASC
jgi:hypothetical protein